MNLFAELRRRNVIRMAGLYLVGAWLFIQIAETLLPIFDTPGWVLKALVLLLALGFVPALVFSWLYELTPDGLKRDSEVDPALSAAPQTAKRMDMLTLAGVLLVVLVIAADRFWPSADNAPTQTAVEQSDSAAPTPDADLAEGAAAVAEAAPNSIAVLPFLNMSGDSENGFFADGISEELLNVLARIDGLTVASRTSAFSFKGKDTPIPEIARLLDVRNVLEGSVRKQGNRVRITAQLIRAGTDKHLWSQTFDRELTDIFQVQEEIAQAITSELMGVLPIGGVSVAPSTSNLEAYERFLSGRARFFQRTELPTAIADLQFAVDSDPTLAEAWVYLAASYSVLGGYEPVDAAESVAAARAALEKAAALVPQHPMVLALEARQANDAGDYRTGLAQMERAAALRSPDSTPVMWLGINLLFAGYLEEARAVLERAQKMDPLSGINNGYLGMVLLALGEEAAGFTALQRAEAMGWGIGMGDYVLDLIARGERQRALALVDAREPEAQNPEPELQSREGFATYRRAVADPDKADDLLALIGDDVVPAALRAFAGNDRMLDAWLAAIRDPNAANALWYNMRTVWLPSASAIREDPRLFKIVEERGLVDLWESRGYPPGCTRVRDPNGDHLDCPGMRP